MSKAWAGGSTRRWRAIRAAVLERDGHRCQLQLPGCTVHADSVHHTLGKAAGDDPAHLLAACTYCNTSTGDPSRHDPAPRLLSSWD